MQAKHVWIFQFPVLTIWLISSMYRQDLLVPVGYHVIAISLYVSDASTLSWGTRIRGFIICFILGLVTSVVGSLLIWVSLPAFAVVYSLGTMISLASTMFLMGPVNQVKKMFNPTRLIATIVLLVCITLTLMAGLWWKVNPLCIVFCIIQFLALTWYSISYIPFARDAVLKVFKSCCD